MKRFKNTMTSIASGLVFCTLAHAGDSIAPNNPYATIIARNAFSLQVIPVEPPIKPLAKPLPKIILKGLMTIFGPEQVLFSVVQNSPGARPGESFYALVEGEQMDGIKVIHIDGAAGAVIFDNHGTVQRISWTDSSANPSGI